MKIDMEFRKGILFIRLNGSLEKKNVVKFNEEVLPVILKHGLKYVVVNLDKLNSIDVKGIEALISLNEIVTRNNGKTSLCNLTKESVKEFLSDSSISSMFYEVSNELSALELFKI